jgi:hypothetical protein
MIRLNPKIITAALNQGLNLIWTLLAFTPIILIWYLNFSLNNLLFSILLSLLIVRLIKQGATTTLQISHKRKFYEKLGVKEFQKFTQDSYYIKRLIEKTGGQKLYFRRNLYLNQLKKIQMYEQYHLVCLLFFSFSAFIGFYNHDFIYTILAVSVNIVYNIIPLLIQQYNRIRLSECTQISKMINHI